MFPELSPRELAARQRAQKNPNVAILIFLGALGLFGWNVYKNLHTPEKIWGAKALDCPPANLKIENVDDVSIIRGCDKTVKVRCTQNHCEEVFD